MFSDHRENPPRQHGYLWWSLWLLLALPLIPLTVGGLATLATRFG